MREIDHFRFDFVCKTGPINVVSMPSGRSWDSLVPDFVVNFDYNRKVVEAATMEFLFTSKRFDVPLV